MNAINAITQWGGGGAQDEWHANNMSSNYHHVFETNELNGIE